MLTDGLTKNPSDDLPLGPSANSDWVDLPDSMVNRETSGSSSITGDSIKASGSHSGTAVS